MDTTSTPITRRRAVGRMAAAGAAAAAVTGSTGAAAQAAAPEPPIRTPAEALAALAAGNRRFVEGRSEAPNRGLDRVRATAPSQAPFALVLACADSRVPVEILFDRGVGDLFVCRTAGNTVSPEIVASLEYGAAVLEGKALLVLGHTGCGAVEAAVDGGPVPGQISTLYTRIAPAVARAGADVEAAVRENVRLQAELLRTASPVLRERVDGGTLAIRGGVYDLATGRVTLLEG